MSTMWCCNVLGISCQCAITTVYLSCFWFSCQIFLLCFGFCHVFTFSRIFSVTHCYWIFRHVTEFAVVLHKLLLCLFFCFYSVLLLNLLHAFDLLMCFTLLPIRIRPRSAPPLPPSIISTALISISLCYVASLLRCNSPHPVERKRAAVLQSNAR